MKLGQVICALRRERQMTQEVVALAAGTDAGYLSRIERGERQPSLLLLESIASALGVKTSAIYAAAEGLEHPPALDDSSQVNFGTDFSEDAIQLRSVFRELSKENQHLAVELLQALSKNQKRIVG
ncbi:MAG: helix-turn-helix transcriptional regulator [Methylotenera sp.]|nr:helix-turn-helix transcriptional regulator [Methylotenera sp.]MDD4925722.1 helix-turn-helix transcriptional regulator [Methylotenera sp.]